jgi:alpha-tubulin suppressor-like RCC1 family protein
MLLLRRVIFRAAQGCGAGRGAASQARQSGAPTLRAAAWGNGDHGRLGVDDTQGNHVEPAPMRGLPADVAPSGVAAGGAHTVVLLADGRVFTCGLNDWGQLGHSMGSPSAPLLQPVAGLPADVVAVAAGHFTTMAVTAGGELWAWGRNSDGQLGLGDAAGARVCQPTRVSALHDAVTAVAAGARHSLALTSAGELYAWGARSLLGLGAAERWRLRLASAEHAPRLVRSLRGVRLRVAAAGSAHSAVTDEDGRVFVFGEGAFNQLGTGSNRAAAEPTLLPGLHSVAALACGGLHTIAATHDGDVFSWGANEHGGLGLGDVDGAQTRLPSRIPGVALTQVSAGWKHSAGITADGELYAWGWGGAMGEGQNSSGGQLGLGDECDWWSPTRVPTGAVRVLRVSCGWNHTAGILSAA